MPRRSGRPEIRISPKVVIPIVAIVIVFGALIAGASTMVTRIEPGFVGVIVNNLTGRIDTQVQPGLVYHLPFGITDVYTIDSRLQVFTMSEGPAPSSPKSSSAFGRAISRPAGPVKHEGRVKVKTSDGGDITMDLTINYTIDPSRAEIVARSIGTEDAYKRNLVPAYSRSLVRDALGRLSIVDISNPGIRNGVLAEIEKLLEEDLGPWGLHIVTVSATNFSYNPRYEALIRERKQHDQDIRNQAAAQETARREQTTMLNEAQREKNVELLRIDGQMRKEVIAAEGDAKERKTKAEGEAYRTRKQGDQAYAVASAEAQALESEGLKRAEGIQALSEAYSEGGTALILESLATKYAGSRIRGRPYDLESTVERVRLEESDDDPEVGAGKVAAAASKEGGER